MSRAGAYLRWRRWRAAHWAHRVRERLAPRTFEFAGARHRYLFAPYNMTSANERQVELPIALAFAAGAPPGEVLEVGNVLAHYRPVRHTVVDKYEAAPGVLNADVVDYRPGRRFRRILSVSTLEHVGWDEPVRDEGKVGRALRHLGSLLEPGGEALVTMPLGHNPAADRLALDPPPGWTARYLVRTGARPAHWREAGEVAPAQFAYDRPGGSARAVAVLHHRSGAASRF